jgi:hypothetical protein
LGLAAILASVHRSSEHDALCSHSFPQCCQGGYRNSLAGSAALLHSLLHDVHYPGPGGFGLNRAASSVGVASARTVMPLSYPANFVWSTPEFRVWSTPEFRTRNADCMTGQSGSRVEFFVMCKGERLPQTECNNSKITSQVNFTNISKSIFTSLLSLLQTDRQLALLTTQ